MTDVDYSPEFRMPVSWFEPPFETDEDPDWPWHQAPAGDPEECPAGCYDGEVPITRNPDGVWDTEPCRYCAGSGRNPDLETAP